MCMWLNMRVYQRITGRSLILHDALSVGGEWVVTMSRGVSPTAEWVVTMSRGVSPTAEWVVTMSRGLSPTAEWVVTMSRGVSPTAEWVVTMSRGVSPTAEWVVTMSRGLSPTAEWVVTMSRGVSPTAEWVVTMSRGVSPTAEWVVTMSRGVSPTAEWVVTMSRGVSPTASANSGNIAILVCNSWALPAMHQPTQSYQHKDKLLVATASELIKGTPNGHRIYNQSRNQQMKIRSQTNKPEMTWIWAGYHLHSVHYSGTIYQEHNHREVDTVPLYLGVFQSYEVPHIPEHCP